MQLANPDCEINFLNKQVIPIKIFSRVWRMHKIVVMIDMRILIVASTNTDRFSTVEHS